MAWTSRTSSTGTCSCLAASKSSSSRSNYVADLLLDLAHVAHSLDDVARARLALVRIIVAPSATRRSASPRSRRRRQTARQTGLVDMIDVVGGGENLGLIDVVDLDGLQDLRLDDVTDAALGHDGDGDGSWMPLIILGSLMRDTPPAARMSAGMRSRAMTAQRLPPRRCVPARAW